MSKEQNKNTSVVEGVKTNDDDCTDIITQIINESNGVNIVTFGVDIKYTRDSKQQIIGKDTSQIGRWGHITTSQKVQPTETMTWRTGKEPGIIMIDVDCNKAGVPEEKLKLAKKLHDDLRKIDSTLYQRTKNGAHFFYKFTQKLPKTTDNVCGKNSYVDIRSEGGMVFVSDPTGEYYGAIEGEKIEAWTQVHDAVLRPLLSDTYIGKKIAPVAVPIDVPVPTVKRTERSKRDNVLPVNGDYSYSAVEAEAVRLYGGNGEGSRNGQLTSACGYIARMLKDDLGENYERICKAVAYSNNPPEDDRSIMQTINSIRQKAQATPSSYEDHEVYTMEESLDLPIINMQTGGEILTSDAKPLEYNAGGWIVMDLPNMISAHPRSMKSFSLLYWCHCIAMGKPVYGVLSTKKMPTLYIDGESDARVLKSRMKKLSLAECPDLHYISDLDQKIHFYNEEYRRQLYALCKEKGIRIVVIDSLGAFLDGDDSDQKAVGVFHDILLEFIREGLTPIVVHHNNKGAGSKANSYSVFDFVRGSTKLQAFYRMMWSIKLSDDGNKARRIFVNTKNSNEEEIDDVEIELIKEEDGGIHFQLNSVLTSVQIFSDNVLRHIEKNGGIILSTLWKELKELKNDKGEGTYNEKNVRKSVERLLRLEKVYELEGSKNARHFFEKDVPLVEAEKIVGGKLKV